VAALGGALLTGTVGGSGVGVRTEEGEGRRGGMARWRAARVGQQWPPAVGRRRCHAALTGEPERLTGGPRP
jgi:hypothetical protein